jgi:ubiquinone biosynthesis protein
LIHGVASHAQSALGRLEAQRKEVEELRRDIRRANQRSFYAVVAAAFIVSAALIHALDGFHPAMLWNAPLMTWILGALGVAILVAAWPRD